MYKSGNGARRRNDATGEIHALSAVQPSTLTHGSPPSPAWAMSNHFDGTLEAHEAYLARLGADIDPSELGAISVECPDCAGHGEVCGITRASRSRFVGRDDLSPDDFTKPCPRCLGRCEVDFQVEDQ